jgi:hypothetical protein
MNLTEQLQHERGLLVKKLAAIDTLLGTLTPQVRKAQGKRTMSAATRAKISKAAKARWAAKK